MKKLERIDVLFGLMLALFTGAMLLGANTPGAITGVDPVNYARSLEQSENVTTAIALATSTACLTSDGAGSTCGLYSFGSVNVVKPTNAATCCWSQFRTGVTIGAQNANTAGRITVGGVTTDCAGYTFAANEPHDMIAALTRLQRIGNVTTYRGRYCAKPIKGMGGELTYVPAPDGTECTTMTGDSTILARGALSEESQNGSAYLHCRAAVDATTFSSATEQ